MTATEIRESLAAIGDAVDVPPVDRVAFQARVRAERRRRVAGRAAVGAAAAAAVVVAGLAGDAVLGDADRGRNTSPAGTPDDARGLDETVYLTVDRRLVALDPRGRLHDVGLRSGGVVGWTEQRVYALDEESRVVVFRVRNAGGVPRFTEEQSPVSGPVQRLTMSGDRRFLAWIDLDDVVHRYDLTAGREDLRLQATPDDYLAAVSEDGVLLATRGGLVLRDAASQVAVPLHGDGFPATAQLSKGLVLVNDRDGRARMYDVRGGSATAVTELPGAGALGPFGERVATIVEDPADRAHVEVWDGRPMGPVTGLEGVIPTELRWADETTLLVAGSRDGDQGLYACDLEPRCGRLPVDGDFRLNE